MKTNCQWKDKSFTTPKETEIECTLRMLPVCSCGHIFRDLIYVKDSRVSQFKCPKCERYIKDVEAYIVNDNNKENRLVIIPDEYGGIITIEQSEEKEKQLWQRE